MNAIVRSWLVLLLFFVACAGAAVAQAAGPDAACTPKFPFAGGWLGSDDAYSIPLPDGRDVWIFGDTLYGKKRFVEGNEPRMVRNAIGVSTCRKGNWNMKYILRRGKDGKPTDFFAAQHPNTWYWALDGVYLKGDLWVTLLCMRSAPAEEAALGFAVCGSDLAHLTGIEAADPQTWKITYSELVPDGAKSYPSATAVVDGDYVYIFANNEFGNRSLVVTRIPAAGMNHARKNLEYLAADGNWKPGFDPKDAKPVMAEGTTELSIRYHPDLKKWIAVMFAPKWRTDRIILRSADHLTGPWTEGETIYRVPEMQKGSPGYDPDTFCYAGKEHPEFEKPGELVFTYACNSMKPAKLVTLTNIYFPRTIRMKMPKLK